MRLQSAIHWPTGPVAPRSGCSLRRSQPDGRGGRPHARGSKVGEHRRETGDGQLLAKEGRHTHHTDPTVERDRRQVERREVSTVTSWRRASARTSAAVTTPPPPRAADTRNCKTRRPSVYRDPLPRTHARRQIYTVASNQPLGLVPVRSAACRSRRSADAVHNRASSPPCRSTGRTTCRKIQAASRQGGLSRAASAAFPRRRRDKKRPERRPKPGHDATNRRGDGSDHFVGREVIASRQHERFLPRPPLASHRAAGRGRRRRRERARAGCDPFRS